MRERNQPRTDVITYQIVQIVGDLSYCFDQSVESDGSKEVSSREASSRKRPHPDNQKQLALQESKTSLGTPTLTTPASRLIVFKGFVEIIPTSPMAELSLIDANLDEYVTRLSLDGTLLFADHRYNRNPAWVA